MLVAGEVAAVGWRWCSRARDFFGNAAPAHRVRSSAKSADVFAVAAVNRVIRRLPVIELFGHRVTS